MTGTSIFYELSCKAVKANSLTNGSV